MAKYRTRILDQRLADVSDALGAVLIEGPRHCGKTTTARQRAGSCLFLDDPAKREQNLMMAAVNPQYLLAGKTPRLLDEWQWAPELWDAVRTEVDERGLAGQFFLTGSAVPADQSKIFHTGTGRIARLRMRPMTLTESGDADVGVSFKELFAGHTNIGAAVNLSLRDIAFLICRGGWPEALECSESRALRLVRDYLDEIIRTDVRRVDGVKRRPELTKNLLRVYAAVQGQPASSIAVRDALCTGDGDKLSERTVQSYIDALNKIFVVEDLRAWRPNIKTKAVVRLSALRYFCDPSLAAAALSLTPEALMDELKTMESLFKTLCVRDLRVYADALDGDLFQYRDRSGLTCDAVLELRNGCYGLIEMKLGGTAAIEAGAKALLRLKAKINTDKMPEPSFLMVITAVGPFAYRREDGVLVVPVGALGL